MRGPSIQFCGVDVRLGGQPILSALTLALRAGEIHCIVGPNGGGKTTLVRTLLGQMPCESGEIRLDHAGSLVVGYAPQALDIDRTLPLTALDVLAVMNQRRPAFAGRATATRREQDAVLERLGLTRKAKRLFGQLSGGERQRLLFAQALLPTPGLLIMDEPTSNMDDDGARIVESIVRELSAGGTTVLWVNHDWTQVRRVAHTATCINRTVTAHGTPDAALSAAGLPRYAA